MKEGWKVKTLGDISVRMVDGPFGSNLKAEHYTLEKEVRIIQLSNIGEYGWREDNTKYTTFEHLKTINRSEVFPNDVVIAKMMPAGRAILCPSHEAKFVLSSDAVKVELKKDYNSRFILYSINSPYFRDQVYANVSGSGRVRTSLTKLRDCVLRIPPHQEQQQIVDFLDAEFAKIDELKNQAEQSLQNAKDLFQAALKEMLTPREGWKEQVLGSLGESKVGPFGSLLHKKDYIENGTPLINPMHIGNGKIKPDTSFSVSKEKLLELQSFVMLENDIVIGRRGEMGRCAVVTKAEEGFVCGTGSIYFRPNTKKVLPLFLQLYLSSDLGKSELEKVAGGATMLNLSSKALNGLVISIPSIERQIEVIDKLNDLKQKVNNLQSNSTRTIQLCADLKQALLRQVFE